MTALPDDLGALDLARALRTGETSAADRTEDVLDLARTRGPLVGA